MISNEMRSYRNNIKYKVESLDILFKDGSIEKIDPGLITHLYIEKDYDVLFFPIMNISVMMNDELYHKINSENTSVKFRVKVNKYVYDANKSFIKYELFYNEVFISFIDKEVIIKDKASVTDKKNTEKDSEQKHVQNLRNFYLFKEDVIKCKEILNLSIKSSSVLDLILHMFNKCKIEKLLMTVPDNLDNINNLLIPSGNLIECVNYVNDVKGLYKKGMVLFFDIDTAYCIDNNSKCTAWRKNEVRMTHIHISNKKSTDSAMTGMFTDKDRKSSHVFSNTDAINISNQMSLHDQLKGNDIKIINNKTNSVSKINENLTQIGKPNQRILVTNEDNKYTVETLKCRMKENECQINISFLGIDIETLNPNKEFLITFEDSELNNYYGGNFRISKITAGLKKDGEELIGEVTALFKKQ